VFVPICIDLSVNILLPRLKVQPTDYYRASKLSVNMNVISNPTKSEYSLQFYHKTDGKKGKVEMCSMYLTEMLTNPLYTNARNIKLNNDSGCHINNYYAILSSIMLVTSSEFDIIIIFWMIPGHTYCHADGSETIVAIYIENQDVFIAQHIVDLINSKIESNIILNKKKRLNIRARVVTS